MSESAEYTTDKFGRTIPKSQHLDTRQDNRNDNRRHSGPPGVPPQSTGPPRRDDFRRPGDFRGPPRHSGGEWSADGWPVDGWPGDNQPPFEPRDSRDSRDHHRGPGPASYNGLPGAPPHGHGQPPGRDGGRPFPPVDARHALPPNHARKRTANDRDDRQIGDLRENFQRENSRFRDRFPAPSGGPPHGQPRGNSGPGPDPGLQRGPAPPSGPPPPPQSLPSSVLPIHQHMSPLMTFKSFMHAQPDDVSPEEYQRRYGSYNIKYVHDFSDTFFHISKSELWFQDRYNPLRMKQSEEEALAISIQESQKIKTDLESHTKLVIKNMCLDKSVQPRMSYRKPLPGRPSDDQQQSIVTTAPDDENPEDMAGKHFSGHEQRAIYVSGIHSSCTLPMFKAAITTAFAERGVAAQPERVVMSQPVWTKTMPSKFERKAWIIMPTESSVTQVLELFTQEQPLTVPVLGPVDPITGNQPALFTCNASLSKHFIRQPYVLPEHLSSPNRVAIDTFKARELAELLDNYRGIPEESNLQSIFKLPAVLESCEKPTDKLDITIAYLRRVHYVVFYGGKSFIDEAHLLTISPGYSVRVPSRAQLNSSAVSQPTMQTAASTANSDNTPNAVVVRVSSDAEQSDEPTKVVGPSAEDSYHERDDRDERDNRGDYDDEFDDGGNKEYGQQKYDQNVEIDYVERDENNVAEADHESGRSNDAESLRKGDIRKVESESPSEANVDNAAVTTIISVLEHSESITDEVNKKSSESAVEGEVTQVDAKAVTKIISAEESHQSAAVATIPPTNEEGLVVEPLTTAVAFVQPIPHSNTFKLIDLKRGHTDRYVEAMIKETERKLARKQKLARQQVPPTRDEEDAAAIAELNEKALMECIENNSKKAKDDKVRCWFPYCNKLFKNSDFLKKHVTLKHDFFASEVMLRNAEPYMRSRYEAEDIANRPLPPIEVEVPGGLEKRSIRDILTKYAPPALMPPGPMLLPPAPSFGVPFQSRDSHRERDNFRDNRHDNRGVDNRHDIRGVDNRHGGNDNRRRFSANERPAPPLRGSVRGRDDRDMRRHTLPAGGLPDSSNIPIPVTDSVSPNANTGGDTPITGPGAGTGMPKRKFSTYMDVDAPKETAKTIDYGIAILPPPKKRKSIKK